VGDALTIVIPLALLLTALGAWLLSSLTMRPVNRLREAMAGVTQKALDQRLPTAGEDREFRELIDAYNTMLARLQASFRQASRFSADAAHELRTPLTILQGRLEQALARTEHGDIHDELADMLEEVERLATVTRKLLLLSQADAGRLALHPAPVDLTEMLDGLMTDAQMLAAGQQVTSRIERGLVVSGDAVLLRQLLNNLVSNAVRYCRPAGWIEIAARRLPAGIEVVFANASAPIGAEDRQRFFDRFYRGDPAHNRTIEGSGLGLSLAREIARAHGGELTLDAGPRDEVRLRLLLPAR
jgi:heavy metal sensor kinase